MSKIIQIEGPDGSGKSFLAHNLIEVYKAAYIHVANYTDKNVTMNQHKPMMDFGELWAHKRGLSPVVLDRHWLTLFVYSMIFDSQDDQAKVLRFLEANVKGWLETADKIIFCLPPKSVYLDRFERIKRTRPQLYTDMSGVYDAFWALYYGKVLDNPVCNTLLGRSLMAQGGMKRLPNVMLYNYMEHFGQGEKELIEWMDKNIICGD